MNIILNFIFKQQININKTEIKRTLDGKVLFDKKNFFFTLFPYQNTEVKKAIKSLKFNNNKEISRFFGNELYENFIETLLEINNFNNFNNPILINIPISKKRLKKRKYNQNDLIIKSFMLSGGNKFVEWEKNNFIKIKDTRPQSHLNSKKERLKNPIGSFKVLKPENIKNKNIIIFDDIYTTGATIKEAKKVLKKAGAKKILLLTLAR